MLTNGAEDRALLIPATPLAPDTYTVTWRIDRPRYRTPTADNTTNYRATATSTVTL